MPLTRSSEIVAFDVQAALEAALEAAEGTIYSFVEFDASDWNHVHVADETLALYDDEAHMEAHFDRIHGYVNLDFTELDLFTDTLVPAADEVRYLVTCLDITKLVRYYHGEEGLFVAVDPGEPVQPITAAMTEALAE